jgi:5-methylcytosine-specific restriction enzyme A
LKFCDTCDSKLINTTNGNKCPKCDKSEIDSIAEQTVRDKKALIYSKENFPFEKGGRYFQKDVRTKLELSMMAGINYNVKGNFLVLFMNAHDLSTQKNNPYIDRFDSETGLYHYTGKGKKGDQTLTGVNDRLAGSTNNNTDVHLFKQNHGEPQHQYMGLVKLKEIIQNTQPDEHGKNRKVYEFILRELE